MKVSPVNSASLNVTQEQYKAVCQLFMPKLVTGLPPLLTYHNAGHIEGVIRDSSYLMEQEGIPQEDRWLILTAALFHDSGFLKGYQSHETISCGIAQETLPAFDFTPAAIDAVCQMIMATKLPQTPLDHYGEILCDADLFYLGTDEFFPTADTLFREMQAVGTIKSKEDWEEKQLNFLHQHRYFTKTALAELEPRKQEHIAALKDKK